MAAVLVAFAAANAVAAEPSRNVDDYFALAFRRMLLKDFHLEGPGCNLGVNCAETGRTCGRLSMSAASIAAPGQLIGDDVCGPGSFYQVFRNNVGAYCSPNCSMISDPGPGPKCETPFDTPILGDLDGDGQPSCGPGCAIDMGDVAAACGVPYPLPGCDPSKGITVQAGGDCVPTTADLIPGNGQCDLKPGVYGMIRVRNRARINFPAGTTVACTLAAGKATRVTSTGPALVLIPGKGFAAFGNLSDVGGACRNFKVVTELGTLRFGKHGEFHLDGCSLAGRLRLGHDNTLRGRFVSGEFIVSNYNNTGECCTGPTTTTSTTTSTTNPMGSTTSTTLPVGPVCCQDANQTPPICGSAPDAAACLEFGGLPGPAGSVCEEAPEGGGRCVDTPPNPGGCCQFEGSCGFGGNINETSCSSLGGAFVDQAVCYPDGTCGPVTTTTTSSTVTTVTSVPTTTVTSITATSVTSLPTTTTTSVTVTSVTSLPTTTSTTTSTLPPGPVCCDDASTDPPFCKSAASATACVEAGGTPGPADSICQVAPSGGGSCQAGPPENPGGCCQLEGACGLGDDIDAVFCSSLGGAFIENAVCTPDGRCEGVGPTTTTTSVPTSSTIPTTSTTTASTVTTATSATSTTATSATSTTATSATSTTATSATSTTATSATSTTATSATSTSSTSNTTATTATSTTVTPSSTTSTTIPGGGFFTRTLGFYKTHPGVTQWILDQVGGISICGVDLTNTNYDDAHSALEALCVSPQGDTRLQLVRQLTAAALTMAAGGATYTDFAACNALCASGGGSVYDIGDCITSADNFNNSGDNLPAPFDGFESGSPEFCRLAHQTDCTVLDPASCN